MQILQSIPELAGLAGPLYLAIGVFDGIHLGHQAVISRAVADAAEAGGDIVVATFHPHPLRVLRPEQAPRLLTSTQHKVLLLRRLGVSNLLLIPFDGEFARGTPEAFVDALLSANGELREICVGHEWSFGRGRSGNVPMLQEIGRSRGFTVAGIPPVKVDGETVSSTLIRSAVEQGDFDRAERLLGRPFTLLGTVVEGEHLGQKIGFPTANLSTHNEQFPPNGVYAVRAARGDQIYQGAVNIGVRPTVHGSASARVLELHLFDFSQDIYGEDVEVEFIRYLRGEQKFASLAELRQQIERDVEQARQVLRLNAVKIL